MERARECKASIAENSYALKYDRDVADDEEDIESWKYERTHSRRDLRFYMAVASAASSVFGASPVLPVRPIRRNRRGKGGKSAAAAAATFQPVPLNSTGV